MLVRELTIENIQSYTQETVEFEDGETLIYGKNGAGKSTLFRSVFGALFPGQGKYEIGAQFNLADFVRHEADQGRIELTFEVGGQDYTVEWVIDSDGSTDTCELRSEALSNPASGVRDVEQTISNDLLEMDASSFISSVYVQQGDIARLVHADQDTRTEILDSLLGLSRVDELIDRAVDARREAKQTRNEAKNRLAEARDQLDDLPDPDALEADIDDLTDDIEAKTRDIEEHEADIDEIDEQLDEWREQLDTVDDLRTKREELETELADTREKHDAHGTDIADAKDAKATAEDELADARDRIDELDATVSDYDLSTADAAESALETIEEQLSTKQETSATLSAKLENAQDDVDRLKGDVADQEAVLDEAKEELEQIDDNLTAKREAESDVADEIEAATAETEAAVQTVREQAEALPIPADADLDVLRDTEIPAARDDIADRLETIENKIGRLQTKAEQLGDLDETGTCPVCGVDHDGGHTATGQSVDDALAATKSDIDELRDEREQLRDHRDALDDLRENITEAVDKQDAVEELETDEAAIQDDIQQLEEELADQDETVAEAEAELETLTEELDSAKADVASLTDDVERVQTEIDALEATKADVEEACEAYATIDELTTEIDQYDTEIEHAREMQRTLQDDIDDLETKIADIESELADVAVDELESKIEEYEGYRETAVEEKQRAETERESLRDDRSAKRAKLDTIEHQQARVDTLTDQKEWGETVVADINEIIAAYEDVKVQLREENVELLNAYTNEVFNDLYQNQSYAGVHIDENYRISLVTSDGAHMKPEVTSGGESTVVNLALRAGVYRLVSKRDSSGGERLPPFILDEPTSFLDDAHVDELHSVIQAISQWNVPQILVVSHNDRLIQNADATLHVEKDPADDASTVTPTHGVPTEAMADDDD
jgi:exonuclease SbcC